MSNTPDGSNDPATVGVIQYSKIDRDLVARLEVSARDDFDSELELVFYKDEHPYCYIEGTDEKPGVDVDFDQVFIRGTDNDGITAFSLTQHAVHCLMSLQGKVTASENVSLEQRVEWAWNNQELCAFATWCKYAYDDPYQYFPEAVEMFTWPKKLRDTVIVFLEDGMDFVEALVAAEAIL